VLTLSERFDDERESDKAEEQAVQLFEAGEDEAVALETAEQALDFIALSVERPVITP